MYMHEKCRNADSPDSWSITCNKKIPSHSIFRQGIHCVCTLHLAHVGTGQVMGWGEKAIEVRSVQTGQLDGVFMHKRVQAFTFLCERNEKVYPHSSTIFDGTLPEKAASVFSALENKRLGYRNNCI